MSKCAGLDFHGGDFGPRTHSHLLGNPLFYRVSSFSPLAESMFDPVSNFVFDWPALTR